MRFLVDVAAAFGTLDFAAELWVRHLLVASAAEVVGCGLHASDAAFLAHA